MSGAVVEVGNLTRQFVVHTNGGARGIKSWFKKAETTTITAVKELSFDIESGSKVAFIGPNGAGKSTTLRILSGLLRPSGGSARVCGYTPWVETRALASQIGLVFGQRSHLWPALSVQDSFDLLAKIYDLDEADYRKQVDKLIGVFGIAHLLPQQARTLSLGQRMRCDIAAALLHQPSVLFLDEPTIGLDVSAKAMLRDHLNSLVHEFDTTLLLTSHDMDDVEKICERVILIDRGCKLVDTSLEEMKREYTRFKTIALITEAESPVYEGAGVKTIEQSSHKLVLSIDVTVVSLEKVVAECLGAFKVQDISIEGIPLEDVVRTIYSQRKAP